MSSFVFDSFKKRYLTGNVPTNDTWHFIPVNENFKKLYEINDAKLYHYRNINDFHKVNPNGIKFELTPEAKQYNKDITNKYYAKGRKGVNLDSIKSWQIESLGGEAILAGNKITRTWSKVIDDNDLSNKPMYVKGSNSAAFFRTQSANITNNEDINSYISAGGFYYIRSKDELTWFANRSNTGNNTIIGVLGDNIEGVINGEPIGKDEAYPFQGILDGNGFTLKNISIQCSNTDNGLVGVLGTSGVVKNFNIDNAGYANSLMCDKKLNLKHIKEDARDINAGILVGRNYGKIYNINALDMKYFNFYGFVPEVYSVTNKSDDYSWSDGKVRKKFDTSNSNYYYMNHFCVNSPGNVCPYVGYFAEGFYSEDYYTVASLMFKIQNNHAVPTLLSGRGYNDFNTTIPSDKIWNMNTNNRKVLDVEANQLRGFNYYILNDVCFNDAATATSINDFNTYVMGNFYGNWFDSQTLTTTTTSYLFNPNDKTIYNMALKMAKQPLYYGLDNKGYYTVGVISNSALLTNNTNICYNTNIIQDTLDWKSDDTSEEWDNIVCPSAYSMASMRMNPLTRAAYNIGIIAGANYGTIEDVVIKVTAQNTSNFVGFYGTIAGKQANGYINNVNVDVDNQFVWDGEDYSYNVTYKNTPILPQTLKDQFNTIAFTWNNVSCYSASTASNLEYYFSSFYENDESVNTATDRMDDCVTYRLRPIIIAGGLFGRYIPTNDKHFNTANNFVNEGCWINNAIVIYKDNFESTNWQTSSYVGNYKRIENAAGIIAGKCDYGVQGIGIHESEILNYNSLNAVNCVFSAITPTGPEVHGYPTSGSIDDKGKGDRDFLYTSSHISADYKNKYNLSAQVITKVQRKYIGIYELKYNACETMCVAIDDSKSMKSSEELQVGKDTGYLYTCDYPIKILSISSEGAGSKASFYLNHNFAQGMTPGCESNIGTTWPTGYNKRNVASWLIHLTNCRTNISPAVVLYDDYLNTWPNPSNNFDGYYLKKGTVDGKTVDETSANIYSWFCRENYYTRRCWPIYDNEKSGWIYRDVFKNDTTNDGVYTPLADNCEVQAVQNTFDGYTYKNMSYAWGQGNWKRDGVTYSYGDYEGWFDSENRYNNPRRYEKGILVWSSPQLCPSNFDENDMDMGISAYNFGDNAPDKGKVQLYGVDYLTASNSEDNVAITDGVLINKDIFNRSRVDDYFYYTYTDTSSKFYSNQTLNDINDSLVQNETINFGLYDNRMGYYKPVATDRIAYRYNYYGIGENLSAKQIRERINNEVTFTTTAVSSNQNFGGLLVIDNSGNNVMFLDNTNSAPLTGNAIVYPTPLTQDGSELLMLEVN